MENKVKLWYEKINGKLTKKTIAVLWEEDMRFIGFSKCHPDEQFNKKRGSQIAIGRAEKALELYKKAIKKNSVDYGYFVIKNNQVIESNLENLSEIPDWLYIPSFRSKLKEVN
jgi:hypothetical protein